MQGLEGFLALVGEREVAQDAGNPAIEQLADAQAVTAAECRHQAEHGRGGNAGHRGAESDAQALDRCSQRGTDGVQVGGAFQRQHGTIQRHHHAEEGAEHAEQHQQANQIGRQAGAGEGDAFTFNTQANRALQGRRHPLQPFAEVGKVVRNRAQRIGKALRAGVKAAQFKRPGDINRRNDQRDGQRQVAAADVARGHPENGKQAENESGNSEITVHGVVFNSWPRAAISPLAGLRRKSSSASSMAWVS